MQCVDCRWFIEAMDKEAGMDVEREKAMDKECRPDCPWLNDETNACDRRHREVVTEKFEIDFSVEANRAAKRIAENFDGAVLDKLEPTLKKHGWRKERTCKFEWSLASNGWADYTCTECGYVENMDIHCYPDHNYCPNCGAKVVD